MWVLESRLYTILKRGILQCYELPSITTFPMVLYLIFDCFLKWFTGSRARKWRKKLCFASFLSWLLLGFSWPLRMELQSQKKRYHHNWFSFVFKCLLLLPLIIFYDYRVSPRDNPIDIQHSVLTYTLHGHFSFVVGFMSILVQAQKTGKAS